MKKKVQTRVMSSTVSNAFIDFKTSHPDIKVGRSTFHELRPKEVLTYDKRPKNACTCIYCENIKFKFVPFKNCLTRQFSSYDDLFKFLICNVENFECAINQCGQCKNYSVKFRSMLDSSFDPNRVVTFEEWKKDPMDGFTKLEYVQMTFNQLVTQFLMDLKDHRFHCHLIKVQQIRVRGIKLNLGDHLSFGIFDFSEHFVLFSQNEVQTAGYGRRQVSIFMDVQYTIVDGELSCESYIFLSDDMKQNPAQIDHYMKFIIEETKKKSPNVSRIIFGSDGSPTQFKNKQHLSSVLFAQQDFGVEMERLFFASYHGKSCADGVAGTFKRVAENLMKNGFDDNGQQKLIHVNNAASLYQLMKDRTKSKVFLVKKEDYAARAKLLESRWKNLRYIPGTRKFHHFEKGQGSNVMKCSFNSFGAGSKMIKM